MSPSEGILEEFFQTLAKQNNFHPNEPHIYAGDINSHVGEEIEAHLSSQEISKLPERVGDDKHPPKHHRCHSWTVIRRPRNRGAEFS